MFIISNVGLFTNIKAVKNEIKHKITPKHKIEITIAIGLKTNIFERPPENYIKTFAINSWTNAPTIQAKGITNNVTIIPYDKYDKEIS
ncbi:hypothetical protein [Spiroplasma endosymbiont of Atherix ibis]|uniref:hypothetical protein n=1 Tax=Spiroplasma endosymbiont of Atherix ibis TaxID=3066291 RepID=UPI0030CCC08F